jgi:hypothetical protein
MWQLLLLLDLQEKHFIEISFFAKCERYIIFQHEPIRTLQLKVNDITIACRIPLNPSQKINQWIGTEMKTVIQ